MSKLYTKEEIKTYFPMSDSCLNEDDGVRTVSFDDKKIQIQIDIKDNKIIYLFWRDRESSKVYGYDFELMNRESNE